MNVLITQIHLQPLLTVPHESDSCTDKGGCNSFPIVSKHVLSYKVDAVVIA